MDFSRREFSQVQRYITQKIPQYRKQALEWAVQHPDRLPRTDYAVLCTSDLDMLSQLASLEEAQEKITLGELEPGQVMAAFRIMQPITAFVKSLLELHAGVRIDKERIVKISENKYAIQEHELLSRAEQMQTVLGSSGNRLISTIANHVDSAIDRVIERRSEPGRG